LNFLDIFLKIHQISRKYVQWEPSCSTLMDGHDESNSCFLQFCNCTKKGKGTTLSYTYELSVLLRYCTMSLGDWWHQSRSWNDAVS